ncbi:type VI secretion system Vgr family protein [Rugamonas aquatica]|uniref:Type VI secretion system tip protein VgrG n=1 Tax=Rugamonas aquatica TaxID=2743357 RepID=A0A6A7NC93_9BURK|nr:type VI secretion system tip protein TssI/VgrG [Rugamonas aquatica]MQA41997.1 type VI secretion system tip protein VgrG [Rugamonas aquatica]
MLDLFTSLTQETRLLRLATPLGADALVVECLRGEEGVSQCYALQVTALSGDADIPLKSLLGQPALLELDTALAGGPRYFHGHITDVAMLGADGGLARYALTIGPWYSFLRHGRDSRVFQDKNVLDILSALFQSWESVGKLVPDWRFDVQDPGAYPVRSLTCQYQESNLDFAERLMREEGLFYYFEHSGAPDSESFGSHVMVIADHNDSFQPNAQPVVRFSQPGAVMREDSMDRWRIEARWTLDTLEVSSWDYRTNSMRPVGAAGEVSGDLPLASRDTPGTYAYQSREHGQRIADQQLQALEATRETHVGAGTVRTLAPGTTFTLTGQAQLDQAADDSERTFVVLRVLHLAHNNLSTDIKHQVSGLLGLSALAQTIAQEEAGSLHAVGENMGERPLYRNRIDAIRSSVPYRSSDVDGHGRVLHPKPTVLGQQTAVVVGPAGAVVHTDRDHRIKVQFHWQRGGQSHSRLNHPAPDGHSGAPGDDQAGTWVRIATSLASVAGANWGAVAVPRIGSEVLIDFIDGNIDRPVVIGSVYNGKGQGDAQHNQVGQGAGAATGNAPAWFPGDGGAHAHPAVLSGLKSQAMGSSQGGSGAYSQMVFDDTPGEPRLALQRHAAAYLGTDELNLGHLRHQTDNQRLQTAGFGAELKTGHSAALRAGQGMLLSTDARNGGNGQQLDSREALAQIDAGRQLQQSLAETAQKHNARLKDGKGADEPAAEKLPAIAGMADAAKVVAGVQAGGGGDAGGAGQVTAYSEPHLQLSSPAGIAATTPASAMVLAGASSSISAGQDVNFAAQGNSMHLVKDGISLFTYGKASSADKPNQETGIKLHAASGKVSVQSQSDASKLTADKRITVASVGKSVTVAAKEHVMLTAQGAFLKLEGGNIMIHGPGTMTFKASMKELTGPDKSYPALPRMPLSAEWPGVHSQQVNVMNFIGANHETGDALVHVPYTVRDKSGAIIASGITNEVGETKRIFTKEKEKVDLFLGDGEWRIFIDVEHAINGAQALDSDGGESA